MNIFPITFSDEMIKVVRSGVKTQTRRVIKPQHQFNLTRCPFGAVDDYLFCREEIIAITRPGGRDKIVGFYSDNTPFTDNDGKFVEWQFSPTWLRPRDMPLRFCRTALKIHDIRVENLLQISENDCKAEGVVGVWSFNDELADDGLHYKTNFQKLWNAINGERGFSWESDPKVWVIEFEQVDLAN